jgi:hypothetical protein
VAWKQEGHLEGSSDGTLSAWSIASSASIAALTALWGLLAGLTSPRIAIAIAGVLLLATPLLLRRDPAALREPVASEATLAA